MYLMQKRQLYQASQTQSGPLMTKSSLRRIDNEEMLNSDITFNNTTADSQVRQTLQNLGNGIAKVFSWAGSSMEGTQA
jgi:hypothetical protein